MKLFIDSADISTIKRLWNKNIFSGITTNPMLLARSNTTAVELVSSLKEWFGGKIFIQARGSTTEELLEDAIEKHNLLPQQTIIKIPSTMQGFEAVEKLEKMNIKTAVTALFTPPQASFATEAGASFIIPFINRLRMSGGNPQELLKDIKTVQKSRGESPLILAASIKNQQDFTICLREGLWGVTIPPDFLNEIIHSPLTAEAVRKFNEAEKHTEE